MIGCQNACEHQLGFSATVIYIGAIFLNALGNYEQFLCA